MVDRPVSIRSDLGPDLIGAVVALGVVRTGALYAKTVAGRR